MEEKKIVVYVLHGFWENEFTNGCTGLEVTQERVDKLLKECHRIFDDKSGRNEMLAQKASKLFEEE